jgi:hypothetical protein
MDTKIQKSVSEFITALGLDEEPMGLFYTDQKPADGFSPKPVDLPTREKEMKTKLIGRPYSAVFPAPLAISGGPVKRKQPRIFQPNNLDARVLLSGSALTNRKRK